MPNRLAGETSPYLLQHKDNPIDWYPWGEEAFRKAREEDKPVFLSIGYSSCHWCHVMAHESFESHEVAKLLNEHFVSIKVDREERPDVDETYMAAVHLSNGRGGWPMSVFMTPDKRPFFAGTYFPKHDRGEYPGMITILRRVAEGWALQRADFEKVAADYDRAIRELLAKGAPGTFGSLGFETILAAVRAIAANADLENGGFGSKPKFPPHTAVELLLNFVAAWPGEDSEEESPRGSALALALLALYRMALGGICDQVGGGFHRYSTDERWLLPHFEKMLYDNALLLANYARAVALVEDADPEFTRVARRAMDGSADWLEREMTSPEGLLYSAIDADSEGEEGKFYVWSADEIEGVLGPDAKAFCELYGVEPEGNYTDEARGTRTGANILHLKEAPADPMQTCLDRLLAARGTRVRPGTDDKALVGWNGLAIAGLAAAGRLEAAARAAKALLDSAAQHGELPRSIRQGMPTGSGYLEDYAYFAWGHLALAEATLEEAWLVAAAKLTAEMVARFYDAEAGGFWGTSSRHEELFSRTKPVFDQPIPSANSVAIRCLLRLGDVGRAEKSLKGFLGWIESAPQSCEGLVLAAFELLSMSEDPPAPAPEQPRPVQAEVEVKLTEKELRAGADGWADGAVVLRVPDGWHVNSHEPEARWLIPTDLAVEPLQADVRYPASSELGYVGETVIPFRLKLPAGESGSEFELTVIYQACTETECLEPTTRRLNGTVIRRPN